MRCASSYARRRAATTTWHQVIDGLRPQVNRIWQSWSSDEQRQFYRHLAPMWEIHRHRAPQSTLDVRDALSAAGRLQVRRGRLVALAADGNNFRVTFSDPEHDAPTELRPNVIVRLGEPSFVL